MKIRYYHFFLMCLVGLGLFLATPAQAELYIAGQFGVTIPSDLTDVEGIQSNLGGTISDLDLVTSPMYGAKIGYFFPNLNWLGIETEFFYANPHVTQQEITIRSLSTSLRHRVREFTEQRPCTAPQV